MERISLEEFRALFRQHTDAIHLESKETYSVSQEDEPFRRFMAGEEDDDRWLADYFRVIRDATDQGTTVRRVRVDESKEALGLRLQDIRKDARLTGRQLAALTGWHFTKVSKIEHGRTMPSESDLEAWCFHCMAQAELPDLIATTRAIEKAYAELRRLHRAGTARYQRELLDRTAKGRRFRVFTTNLVPGAFQTPAYAATVLTDAAEMLGHPADVEATVAARLERARTVQTGGRFYHAVILENVLNAGVVPTDVMTAQLRHMLEMRQAPSLHLGVIPTGTRRYMPMCEFNITDDTAVDVETFSAIIRVTQPREIAVYAKVFDHYARQAVYGQAASKIIRRSLAQLE